MRIAGIDLFRGLSIILMVIFTLIQILSGSLPDLLVHNRASSLHFGDVILPMFLFASGMSLVFFHRKRKNLLDIIERSGKLLMVWFFLSIFSAGELMGMDEIMLSVLLFIPTSFLLGKSRDTITIFMLLPFAVYLFLSMTYHLPDFSLHYIGGYGAALFYWPVMLAGVSAGMTLENGKWSKMTTYFLVGWLLVSIVLLILFYPAKLNASPSFMGLSIIFSLMVYGVVSKFRNGILEYLGQKPLRYWIFMYLLIIIPLAFYWLVSGELVGALNTVEAIILSLSLCVVLLVASKAVDGVWAYFKRKRMTSSK